MTVLVVVAHPDRGSFNHAIAEIAARTLRRKGCIVTFHDLYREGFPPVLPGDEIPMGVTLAGIIEEHCAEVASAEGFVIVHPNWWGQPPAILKGWIDRVFRSGVAYEFEEGDSGEGVPMGLLKAETAIVFNTSNTLPDREREVFRDPLETIWRNCIFGLCGVKNFHRRTFSVVVTSTKEQRTMWLREVEEAVNETFFGRNCR
ncbi:MAG TPA: NAD(P)H-dependent oxidoreductase [Syntrophales bacterium]|nr:NAD(P)H-dependent oxidoreductase [Syntrophales bacterium]